ncbi:MAG: CPXCG motif-containing cysteine-rich protein [Gammaproteobacteria bacterium]|nr:CPXCG motif-containing cysteine-rich protein [Gammaproteobacteria bacterium]NNL50326.1 CPXCG motif-containing cysteine-rich protein [Woeseiaceae bacterium]
MRELEDRTIHCPYCGEGIDVLIDHSVPQQNYIEDCQVCCRPINFSVAVEVDGRVELRVTSENE